MGKRITIHRPERLKYVKRPEGTVGKTTIPEAKSVARFYADDVEWEAAGPVQVAFIADENGVHDVREMQGVTTHRHGINAPGVNVRDSDGGIHRIELHGLTPEDRVHVEMPTEPYRYVYANGLPVWRIHNQSGDVDAAHIVDNDMMDRWDLLWMHFGNSVPVHIEHIERIVVENTTIADIHRAMHPHVGNALSNRERVDILDSPRGMHLSINATDEELIEAQNTPLPEPPERVEKEIPMGLKHWCLWRREWHRPGQQYTQRLWHLHFNTWRRWQFHCNNGAVACWGGLLVGGNVLFYVMVVAPRLGDLLQILKQ